MQAGRRGWLRRAATRCFGASGLRFPSLFDVDREPSRAATHVDARDGVLSDAGSTPAASTIRLGRDAAEANGALSEPQRAEGESKGRLGPRSWQATVKESERMP